MDANTLAHYSGLIQQFCIFDIDQPFVAHPFYCGDGRLDRLWQIFGGRGRGGISFTDMYRHILHLNWDAPLALPAILENWQEEAQGYAKSIGMIPGKSVILFPDNNSGMALPSEFWQALADELVGLGNTVFTNLAGNMHGKRAAPFTGTSSIEISISSVIPLVEIAGRYICGANGMGAMLAGCRVKSQGTYLMNERRSGDVAQTINGTVVSDTVRMTSLRTLWVTNDPVPEYVVCPDEDMTQIIRDIASNNPETALPPATYPEFPLP
jgi:hypothetical protein